MNIFWYIRRLSVMSSDEIFYRVHQKLLSSNEFLKVRRKLPVYKCQLYGLHTDCSLDVLGIVYENSSFSTDCSIDLIGSFEYEEYKKRWSFTFNNDDWPTLRSDKYNFNSPNTGNDIRKNWELNRHRQFAKLSKAYFVTGDIKYLKELSQLFYDWNAHNPFLWGPEWSSPMEISIRLINWAISAAFLSRSKILDSTSKQLLDDFVQGIWTMYRYISRHYSKYSSANNHTIIEALGVLCASLIFHDSRHTQSSLSLLQEELKQQNFLDGVNKEQSLHYQFFEMEAVCLAVHFLRSACYKVPAEIIDVLSKMIEYCYSCSVGNHRYIEFGDNDKGCIVNLSSSEKQYEDYVLAFGSLLLQKDKTYIQNDTCCETLYWFFDKNYISSHLEKGYFGFKRLLNYPNGGLSIIRDTSSNVVCAFDYGPLGLGRLAAHGHADALSFQFYFDSEPVFIDSGTFIYNGNIELRNKFRSTAMHNTVTINCANQSAIEGPFLWGCRADAFLDEIIETNECITITAHHNGYKPLIHTRTIIFSDGLLSVQDHVVDSSLCSEHFSCTASFHVINEPILISDNEAQLYLDNGRILNIHSSEAMKITNDLYSPEYGVMLSSYCLTIPFDNALSFDVEF